VNHHRPKGPSLPSLNPSSLSVRCAPRLATLIALLVAAVLTSSVAPVVAAAAPAADGTAVRVVDGDTIVATVGGIEDRVRFLNVDTPEVGTCMADQATAHTARRLPSGQVIELRYDRDLRDPYDRLLALVRPEAGEWLSVSLAERGLGFPLSISPNDSYYGRVVAAARRAKQSGVGMFSPRRSCTPVSRVRRAGAVVTQAQSMPVRTRAQYDAVNRRLAQASALVALASAARYGIRSAWFTAYSTSLRTPVLRRVAVVRAAKKRQWNIVRNASNNDNNNTSTTTTTTTTTTSNPGGWWPPGVSHSYTGPRCYEPGGVIWYPC